MNSSAIEIQDAKLNDLGLSKTVVNEEQVCCYSRNLGSVSERNPILLLLHGYPQSSYMWRHVIPLLSPTSPLFVPDLPGYGASAPIQQNDKLSVGKAIVSALKTLIKRSTTVSSLSAIPIVLIGHDRGARVCHRLAVSGVEGISILGACLMDIVPTLTQWAGDPLEITGYFHWPLLANVELAQKMITAYGGDNWCRDMIKRWAGKNDSGFKSLSSDDSLSVYASFFSHPATIKASNEDYAAGATTDVDLQKGDQDNGRRIKCPLLLIYSKDYIGKRFNVPKEWANWVDRSSKIDSFGIGDGIGHFVVEEAPRDTAGAIGGWLEGNWGVSGGLRIVRGGVAYAGERWMWS
ncbi:alpha/beta-hydrolase [Delitschia confertaspora ATCC 74209]|uniref:Alpha/beta-hydrolase n=1 Tax=Delitschia confertaspora ATCC 74209 TaxID=1513339 RepID=A0A9P4JP37_9PLEO|nr:alpha/beta-hydrolase [Delitschia confertaspora ATCC 74209]